MTEIAFPTIPTTAAGRVLSNTQADNNGTRVFPSLTGLTKNSGDLLIAICVVYQSSASAGAVFSGWGGGFTEFLDVGGTTSNMSIGAAYKVSNGSETGTFTVTQAATVTGHAAMFLLSIPGAHQTTPPEGGTVTHGTTTSANIASLNPAGWGTQDTLWIAIGGVGETATTGSFSGIGTAPTNYGSTATTGISADVVGGLAASVAFRQLTAASDDPATWVTDGSNARNSAVLLAVRPAPTQVTITQAEEIDSPQQIFAATNTYDLTLVAETDTVGTIVPFQPLPATETDSPQFISTTQGYSITTVTETDSVQALNIDKALSVTTVTETDLAILQQKKVGLASETDSATTLTVTHANDYDLTLVTETDLAGDIVEFQVLPGTVTETAQTLVYSIGDLALTPATETDSAQALSFLVGGNFSIAPATETDLANQIVSLQPLPATETDSVQALDYIFSGRSIAVVNETDTAVALTRTIGYTLTEYEATAPLPYNLQEKIAVGDTSTAVTLSVTTGVGNHKSLTPVTETDLAGGFGTNLLPNPSWETDTSGWSLISTGSMIRSTPSAEGVPTIHGPNLLSVLASANSDGIQTTATERIVVDASHQYTFSIWVFAAVATNVNVAINEYTSGGTLVAGAATGQVVPQATWTRLSLTVTTNASTGLAEVLVYVPTGAPKQILLDGAELTAAALSISKAVTITTATSTAAAQTLTLQKSVNITTATSTAAAVGLTFTQTSGTTYTIDLASDTATATALVLTQTKFLTLTPALEIDFARIVRAANRPTGGLVLSDHAPDDGLALIDHVEASDLALIDV